jgi:iron complex outermembrane recepter protein
MEVRRYGTGVQVVMVLAWAGTAVAQPANQVPAPPAGELPPIIVVAPAPLPSPYGVPRDRLPYFTRSFGAEELTRGTGRADLPGTLELELGGLSRNEAQANPFQPDIQFRGFVASPLLGMPQGLAVYQDGVRINEALGDALHWDLIPEFAIRRADLLPSNPIFGLNAIGGALSLQMRDGFSAPGARLRFLSGSFGGTVRNFVWDRDDQAAVKRSSKRMAN